MKSKGASDGEAVIPSESILIPTWVLTDRSVSVLEAIVSYLKDGRHLTYHKIALLLKRNDRTIWTSYNRTLGKKREIPELSYGETFPSGVVADRSLSVFESIVEYLKENKSLRYTDIAELTKRDDRTIWTVYSRAKKKRGGQHG